MPSALPDYVDSNTTQSFTLSGNVAVNASGDFTVRLGLRGTLAAGTAWRLFTDFYQDGGDWITDLYAHAPLGDNGGGFPPFPVKIDTINHGGSPPVANTFFPAVAFSSTIGPLRLGAIFNLAAGAGPVDAAAGLVEENTLELDW